MFNPTSTNTQRLSRFTTITSKPWAADLAAVGLLAAAVLFFFWPVISGRAWIPQGGGDLVSFIYPMYRFTARSLHAGQIPLWNPYQYAGAPFLADNQSGIFYPFNLALFLLTPAFTYKTIEGLVIWHFFFAGAAMYTCLRWLRVRAKGMDPAISRLSALLGAFAFMFSGAFINHIGHLNLIAVAAWLPLAFAGLHRAIEADTVRQRIGWSVGGGLALGIGALAGHGQITFLTAAFLGAYALYITTVLGRRWALPLLALVAVVAVSAAALSLFPTFASLPYTLRAEFDFARSTNFSLTPQALLGLFAPDFFGRGIANFWGAWTRVEFGYAGILPWALTLFLIMARPSRKTLFFALAGLFFLLLALGPNTPLYALVFGWLPTVPFRVPARFLLLADFCLAVTAAVGADFLRRDAPAHIRKRLLLIVLGIMALVVGTLLIRQYAMLAAAYPNRQGQMVRAVLVFAFFAGGSWLLVLARLRGWLTSRWWGSAALLWLAIDLISLGRYVEIEWNDPTLGYPEDSAALSFVRADPGLHRVDIATGAWQPNLPQLVGLYSIGGIDNPLQLSNYTVIIGSVGYRGSTVYNLLGAKYVISEKTGPPGDTTFIVPVYNSDPNVDVYLNTRALPRVQVLYSAELAADHDAAFAAIHHEGFDPTKTVILEEGRPLAQPPGHAEISIVRYDLNEVAFDVSTDRPSYFLLTDIFHPNWKATVDGQEAPILEADYAFRALFLEPGVHRIEMRFIPRAWSIGMAVSILTWMGILAFVTHGLWKRHIDTA